MADAARPRLLITGAAGLLGRAVVQVCREHQVPHAVTTRQTHGSYPYADLRQARAVQELLADVRPSVVLHCAGVLQESPGHPFTDNCTMMEQVATYADCPIVAASSMSVYTPAVPCPVREEAVTTAPESAYARSKWEMEQCLLARQRPGDLLVRLPGLFSPRRTTGLLAMLVQAAVVGTPVTLQPSQDYWAPMAVEDAASCLVFAATHLVLQGPAIMNLGYDGWWDIQSVTARVLAMRGRGWTPPDWPVRPFKMDRTRWLTHYGPIAEMFEARMQTWLTRAEQELAYV